MFKKLLDYVFNKYFREEIIMICEKAFLDIFEEKEKAKTQDYIDLDIYEFTKQNIESIRNKK